MTNRINWESVAKVVELEAIDAKILWRYIAYGEICKREYVKEPELFLNEESDEVTHSLHLFLCA